MPEKVTPSRTVQQVGLQYVAALQADGLFPTLPTRLIPSQVERCTLREPAPFDMLGVTWYAYGNLIKPSGVMALRTMYDFAYKADVLEMLHISGSKRAIVRLLCVAKRIAAERSIPLTGETEISNRSMIGILQDERMDFSLDRLRLRWEP